QAPDLLERGGVVDDHRTVRLPDADESMPTLAVELDVGGGPARRGPERAHDFEGLLVDHVYRVAVLAEEDVDEGVSAVLMAAHEEPRSQRVDAPDGLERLHVDHGHLGAAQVR